MIFRHHNQPQVPRRQPAAGLGRPPTYSYYARRSQEQAVTGRQVFREETNQAAAARAVRLRLRRLSVAAVAIIGIAAAANILWLSPQPKVIPLGTNTSAFLHSTAAYQATATKLFAGSVLNRSKLTVNAGGISAGLKHAYPELGVVTVVLPLIGHQPVVYVGPTTAQLRLQTLSGTTYAVDSNGRVLGPANSGDASLAPVLDQSGTPVVAGQPVLSSDTVAFIQAVRFQMAQKHVSIARFTLPAGTSELDMYMNGTPYFVKFNLAGDTAVEQAGTFLAVRHRLTGEGKLPGAYIDVRVPGRAYYK